MVATNARMEETQSAQKITANVSVQWDGRMITVRHRNGVISLTMVLFVELMEE
jgi:hypothetical protein